MTIGEHLEELRRRIFHGLAGFVIAAAICLIFGQRLVSVFCRPLFLALQKNDISPQLYVRELTEGFMVYIQISMVCALAIASPWMVYQLWRFVATGLYPAERKYITKYVPLSITLLISGMLFLYFLVLPWSLEFFIAFSNAMPLPVMTSSSTAADSNTGSPPTIVQALRGDPAHPSDYQLWFDTTQNCLKFSINGQTRVIPFSSSRLIAIQFTLTDYVDLVIRGLVVFGLAFQLPLVVMALAKVGIVDVATFKRLRRYIYFGIGVIAAALTPGDVVTTMVALWVPMVLLYEFGIFLAQMGERKAS